MESGRARVRACGVSRVLLSKARRAAEILAIGESLHALTQTDAVDLEATMVLS
jgi:hypothetical protein